MKTAQQMRKLTKKAIDANGKSEKEKLDVILQAVEQICEDAAKDTSYSANTYVPINYFNALKSALNDLGYDVGKKVGRYGGFSVIDGNIEITISW